MKRFQSILYSIFLVLFLAILPVFSQSDSVAEIQKGYQYLQNKDFPSAIKTFSKVLQNDSNNDKARIGLAIGLVGVEKFAEASREIAKLLARSPKDTKLLEMAAQTFWVQKRFAETETVLKRRLKLEESTAEWWALYGDALDAQKKTIEAVVAYEKAVSVQPDSITFRYALGSLYWKQIRYDEATKEFLDILRREPNEPRASFNLGDIYLTNGDAAKALPYLEVSAKTFPDEFDTRFALGRAYSALKKYPQAILELEAAVKLRPEIPEGFYHLGLALQKNGRREEAKIAFDKTQKLQNTKRLSENPSKKNP